MAHPGAPRLTVSRKQDRKIRRILSSPLAAQALALRARIVQLAAQGMPGARIARHLGCAVATVRRWRERFRRRGVAGLFDRRRSGRREVHGPSRRLAVVAVATSLPPEGSSVWSRTLIAEHLAQRGLAISPSTVGRVLAEAKVRPHKVRGWLNRADDPVFWTQAGAVCRLYLAPPPGTLMLSVDEKTGIQATSRRHPTVRPRPGRDERREFEYRRHGTVSIVAAMDVATGQVLAERIGRNDSVTFIGFLRRIEQCTDPAVPIHLIMDNGSSHTSRATRAWLQAHPRFTVTYTPKHASWLNMI
ncbi:IS630 family transposase, partial [Streptomyces dysideae]|uniref:IS630 family transposase n=1 Tax=Streptomyces dysideae TaxID=909626 RepID=UPI000A8C26DD